MTVHFIGAGPGAADLITLRGQKLIESCKVCLYAGSLVPSEILTHCPEDAQIINTAPLDLDAIIEECKRALSWVMTSRGCTRATYQYGQLWASSFADFEKRR